VVLRWFWVVLGGSGVDMRVLVCSGGSEVAPGLFWMFWVILGNSALFLGGSGGIWVVLAWSW
jgi:hypothetical protein